MLSLDKLRVMKKLEISENEAAKSHRKKDDCFISDQLFGNLQILTAIFASFVHGGNDVRWV
jgi:phosphate/sulfate permease